jgi:hypothetical protein
MKSIEPDPMLADEYLEGVEWVLSRDPTAEAIGLGTESDGIWVTWVRRDDVDKPPIAVFFIFTDESVELIGASAELEPDDL